MLLLFVLAELPGITANILMCSPKYHIHRHSLQEQKARIKERSALIVMKDTRPTYVNACCGLYLF